MIAIHTKYMGPTNTRGGRIKAYNGKRSLTIDYPHELNSEQAHYMAAKRFIEKHLTYVLTPDRMVYGDSADGRGYVFCFVESVIKDE